MKLLVTGAAGFIGSALSLRLLDRGDEVLGLDNLSSYYDVTLKEARLKRASAFPKFTDVRTDIRDRPALSSLFAQERPERVVHLAAQAGVRYSITHPETYAESNLVGFLNVLEACRHHSVEHLVFA